MKKPGVSFKFETTEEPNSNCNNEIQGPFLQLAGSGQDVSAIRAVIRLFFDVKRVPATEFFEVHTMATSLW